VSAKSNNMGSRRKRVVNTKQRWTFTRDEVLRQLHGTMPIADIAAHLGTTRASIRGRITRLGIRKRSDAYSEIELDAIRAAYEKASFNEEFNLSALMNCETTFTRSQQRIAQLINIGRPLTEEESDELYRALHADYMRKWRAEKAKQLQREAGRFVQAESRKHELQLLTLARAEMIA
jgi:DNA-binding Lrp family transcriptional regulator